MMKIDSLKISLNHLGQKVADEYLRQYDLLKSPSEAASLAYECYLDGEIGESVSDKGWAFYEILSCVDAVAEYELRGFDEQDMLIAIALYWFNEADYFMMNSNPLAAIDKICDAFSALQQASRCESWSGAEEFHRDVASMRGKDNGDATHIEHRKSREAIREIWASGKYTSRDICAEQECVALEMSFSTARKALRNTLNPT